jgi:UDP-N-acetylglucosamine 1-carboxyvinyltransferase
MAAALLTTETVTLHNLPYVRDIITMRRLLEDMGCTVLVPELRTMRISARGVDSFEAPYDLVKTMRASVLVLGPLVARFGQAKVSLPGGCAIGQRPIDLHLSALEKMGARVRLEGGYIIARAERLRGCEIYFDKVSVTATENIMMAAALSEGTTTLINAAREPEVVDLAELLIKMGASIESAGDSVIRISGTDQLGGADHTIIPDRIEAGTFIVAAAITGGSLAITDCAPGHLTAVIDKLREVGVQIEVDGASSLIVRAPEVLIPSDVITMPYPGFPTDMQAQYMALMTRAAGTSVITETIFENRFMHAAELLRMGARIRLSGRQAIVEGGGQLMGARVIASDLRASASLVLAGLAASGQTIVDRVYHIDRGYEKIEEKLRSLGADIERMRE